MKILTVVGTRPQFIKAAPVSTALRAAGHHEFFVHTGQHYDYQMSQVFFDELSIRKPDMNLEVGSGTHGWQTGQMLIGLERLIQEQQPDKVLVYGDTNSTLAGALAAVKLRVPLAHVEAGLRSFNRDMPEEHNRVLTDHCADLLFCPTQTAINHLANEGIRQGVHWVGDTMYDAVLQFTAKARQKSTILQKLQLEPKRFILATIHRPYNTDVRENLANILAALRRVAMPVIFPVHPRTKNKIRELDEEGGIGGSLYMIEPVGYLDMLLLEENAALIVTDSGGIQKEAYFFAVPCVTVRPETEWVETVEAGWNVLVEPDHRSILSTIEGFRTPTTRPSPVFGHGDASTRIAALLAE